MNITELARKLKITPNVLKQELPKLGFHIGQRAIQIPDKQAEKVISLWQEKTKKEEMLFKIKEKMARTEVEEKKMETNNEIILPPKIQTYRLAEKMGFSVKKVMNELIKNGVLASVNENLDYEVAAIISENLGFKPKLGEEEEKKSLISLKEKLKEILIKEMLDLNSGQKKELLTRAPVVVVMGHVDHGKSSILDAIRESQIVSHEKGGITQHIGAYQVEKNNHFITFIDTPGHEAFKAMRARGGEIADLAILVVAADDGIQPQTMESIKVIQQENIPFIIAINKIDKPGADPERVKKELSEINLMPEEWGGKTICVQVSAKTKKGIDDLLETINLIADMEKENLITNPNGSLVGAVIESHLDLGCGPVASAIIYNGVLKQGDNIIAGDSYGRVRSLKSQLGIEIKQVPASLPIQIFGLKELPQAGDLIEVVDSDREFKKRVKQMSFFSSEAFNQNYTSLEKENNLKEKNINLIIRADVIGSLGAIEESLNPLKNDEVKIKIIKKGLGDLTESDVDLARTTNARLVGFGTKINNSVQQLAHDLGLKIKIYYVIYDLVEDLRVEINTMLSMEIFEEKIGEIEVLKTFQQSGKETILGGKVIVGRVIKNAIIRVWSKAKNEDQKEMELTGEGRIGQLQIEKKDINEVRSGTECGLKFIGKAKIEVGDKLDVYQENKKQKQI